MYFRKTPFIEYVHAGRTVLTPNIMRRTALSEEMKNNRQLYIAYTIKDGETPEMLSDRIYDSPDYAFVILMVNDIHNVFEDWPLPYHVVVKNAESKYGDVNQIHHYESLSGNIVGDNHPEHDRVIVTNLEHETKMNEAKREIKILHPEYLAQFVKSHHEKMTV